MTVHEILIELNPIFSDILDVPALSLDASSSAKTIPEWDSLNHIQLVVAVEKHFKIRFTSVEIQSFNNVGEMCEAIIRKKA